MHDTLSRFVKKMNKFAKKLEKSVNHLGGGYMKNKISTIQKRENLNVVERVGEAGPGGAYHHYDISYLDKDLDINYVGVIKFQKGPRNLEDSKHGVTDEDLLEIVRDRLTCFCNGDMPTRETEKALEHIEEALMWLNKRTEDRIERKVLGTYED